MGKVKRAPGPVFARVLRCFESDAEFARQVGLADRRNVREWKHQLGYIPLRWALVAANATCGKVSPVEIVNETARLMERRAVERATLRAVGLERVAADGGDL